MKRATTSKTYQGKTKVVRGITVYWSETLERWVTIRRTEDEEGIPVRAQ
jgi:hypothetical protein